MEELLIYNPKPSPRKRYMFELIFNHILGVPIVSETNKPLGFSQIKGVAKLNYSQAGMADIPWIYPDKFMEEEEIRHFKPSYKDYYRIPASFFHEHQKTSWPFDVFAHCFYLVSRYEEYLDFQADEHGRFTAHQSLAYKHHFLDLPLVNLWAQKLKRLLQKYYPTLQFNPPKYKYTPTYDIDHAYAFLQKGFVRQIGAMFRNFKHQDFETLGLQFKSWFGLQKDPYYVFDYLNELDQKYQLSPIYFWLLGDYGAYDKNIHYTNKKFRKLISENAKQHPVGIHPSYGSNNDVTQLDQEIQRLEALSPERVSRSRQHYLKLTLPDTYDNLVHYKIKEDYSMGYAQEMGFRASMATPFYWFNLRKNEATDLLVYPFQIMDVTLNVYQKLTPKKAIEKAKKIIHATKAVDGHLIIIWHNSSLCEAWNWRGWRKVYETLIIEGIKK